MRKVLVDVHQSLDMPLQDGIGEKDAERVLNLSSQGLVFGGETTELAELDLNQQTLEGIYSVWLVLQQLRW